MKPVAVVPALCTLGNVFCGFLAIAKGADAITYLWSSGATSASSPALPHFHHLIAVGCWLIFLANVFDALDGRLARMTKSMSDFGAMLDSLADMLTFGAAPALLLKFVYEAANRLEEHPIKPKIVFCMCFLFAACAALRLARFTAETEEDAESHDFFKGLPTPAAALFVASGLLFYVYLTEKETPSWLADHRRVVLIGLLASLPALALLMVSRVRYVHVVNRFMRGRQPYTYVAQVVVLLLLLSLVGEELALLLLCGVYVVGCPVIAAVEAMTGHRIIKPGATMNDDERQRNGKSRKNDEKPRDGAERNDDERPSAGAPPPGTAP